ncbi:MAG: hypothetical protein F4007_12950 [Chloroflexi bacterium]|nr:hypothetical protein [Chloroflexota bacterium]
MKPQTDPPPQQLQLRVHLSPQIVDSANELRSQITNPLVEVGTHVIDPLVYPRKGITDPDSLIYLARALTRHHADLPTSFNARDVTTV